MSTEYPQPAEPFQFTEQEKLYDQISDTRFRQLIADTVTTIHKAAVDTNNYGEFVFVTLSHKTTSQQEMMTFWGMGYHEYRERWLTEQWHWYKANPSSQTLTLTLPKGEVEAFLNERRAEITPHVERNTQSARGKLFEMLADLTDDDGAMSEMDDLGDLWDDLADGLE